MRRPLDLIPLAALYAPTLLGGCQTPQPEEKRWDTLSSFEALNSADIPKGLDAPNVNVYVFPAAPKDPTAAPTLKELSDRGQAALIGAMIAKGADAAAIRKAVLTAKDDDDKPKAPIAGGKFSRTLVATVTKGLKTRPGDRLMWTLVVVKPMNFTWAGYTVLATDVQSLNVAHLQSEQDISLEGTVKTLGPEASITPSIADKHTASTDISQQYTKTSIDIVPKELRIYRESERNQDVAGNTLLNLSLNVGKGPTTALRLSNMDLGARGKWKKKDEVDFDVVRAEPPPHCALKANVTLYYQLRTVDEGADRYNEGAQKVRISQAHTELGIIDLVPMDEVRPLSYKLYMNGAPKPVAIQVKNAVDGPLDLEFTDFDEARNFAAWLNQLPGGIPASGLAIGKSGALLVPAIQGQGDPGPFYARYDQKAVAENCTPPRP